MFSVAVYSGPLIPADLSTPPLLPNAGKAVGSLRSRTFSLMLVQLVMLADVVCSLLFSAVSPRSEETYGPRRPMVAGDGGLRIRPSRRVEREAADA